MRVARLGLLVIVLVGAAVGCTQLTSVDWTKIPNDVESGGGAASDNEGGASGAAATPNGGATDTTAPSGGAGGVPSESSAGANEG